MIVVLPMSLVMMMLGVQAPAAEPPTSQPLSDVSTAPRIELRIPETGDVITTQLIILDRSKFDEATTMRMAHGLRIVKGVMHVDHDDRVIGVMVDSSMDVNAPRLIEFLRLAGYETHEANSESYQRRWQEMMGACGAPLNDALSEDEIKRLPRVVDLKASIDPLRDWFNRHADEPRFVVILSPT